MSTNSRNFHFPLLLLLFFFTGFPYSQASPELPQLLLVSKARNGGVSLELWCVAKNNAEDATLQSALSWACGPGGASCAPIQDGGLCYDPSDFQKMASYAFNDYYLKHGLAPDACNFDNNAALTSLNPSSDKCRFPSSLSVQNGNGSFMGSSTVGLGPPYGDMSGCRGVLNEWLWLLFSTHLLLVMRLLC